MLGKRSMIIAISLIACIVISLSPTAARSRHQRQKRLGDGRSKSRHRSNNNNRKHDENRGSDLYSDLLARNHSSLTRARTDRHGGHSVPSLHAMQTFGVINSGDRKERTPIRGSRNAVVVTKKTYLKKEWCKTQPLKQVVRMRGCLRTKILNNFCYGQCNSFFIPKKARQNKNAEAFLSCGFCRPRRFRWILVTLRCPTKHGVRYKRKRVQYIKKCRCMAQEVSMDKLS